MRKWLIRGLIVGGLLASLLMANVLIGGRTPYITINPTPSMYTGVYRQSRAPIEHGDMIVFRPPARIVMYSRENRVYHDLLLKRVHGLADDVVCIDDDIWVNGVWIAPMPTAIPSDYRGWDGKCTTIPLGQAFVLGDYDGVDYMSFDSRYFGLVSIAGASKYVHLF